MDLMKPFVKSSETERDANTPYLLRADYQSCKWQAVGFPVLIVIPATRSRTKITSSHRAVCLRRSADVAGENRRTCCCY